MWTLNPETLLLSPNPMRKISAFRAVSTLVIVSGLVLGTHSLAFAQDAEDESVKTESDDKSEKPIENPQNISSFGRLLPTGWSLHASTQAAGIYDDNFLSSTTAPTSDISTGIRMLTTLAF